MQLIGRRNFVRGLGLGGAGTLLAPLCRRIVSDALGQARQEMRLVFLVQGNAWATEEDNLNHPGTTDPGKKSLLFESTYRSPQDFDLPVWMQDPFGPFKNEVAMWFGLVNHNNSTPTFPLHGCGSGVLTALKLSDVNAPAARGGGISIDRLIGKELRKKHQDPYDSTVVGLPGWSNKDGPCPSYDAAGRPAPAFLSPLAAYTGYFGNALGKTPQQVEADLEAERSLLDGIRQDVARVQRRIGGGLDAEKLEQGLQSLRELEGKLQNFRNDPRLRAEKPPAPTMDKTSQHFNREMVRGLIDVTGLLQAWGLSHVSLVSIHGEACFSDSKGWTSMGGPGFSDYGEMHNGLFHSNRNPRTYQSLRNMHKAMAEELVRLRRSLAEVKSGPGSVWDETAIVWIANGGLRHHWGNTAQLMVMLAGARTGIKTPHWADFFKFNPKDGYNTRRTHGSQDMGSAYVSLANAAGVPITEFGTGKGGLPDVLKG